MQGYCNWNAGFPKVPTVVLSMTLLLRTQCWQLYSTGIRTGGQAPQRTQRHLVVYSIRPEKYCSPLDSVSIGGEVAQNVCLWWACQPPQIVLTIVYRRANSLTEYVGLLEKHANQSLRSERWPRRDKLTIVAIQKHCSGVACRDQGQD